MTIFLINKNICLGETPYQKLRKSASSRIPLSNTTISFFNIHKRWCFIIKNNDIFLYKFLYKSNLSLKNSTITTVKIISLTYILSLKIMIVVIQHYSLHILSNITSAITS